MMYQEPFVLYLNVSVCLILLFLALPTLLNRREDLRVRLAFSLIFFTVITNVTTNVSILLFEQANMVPLVFMLFFIPLLFGPSVFFYVRRFLGAAVPKSLWFSVIPGVVSFVYGVYLMVAGAQVKEAVLAQIIAGEHLAFNGLNVLALVYIMLYCAKSWWFLREQKGEQELRLKERLWQQQKKGQQQIKLAWVREFILYVFVPVFTFSIFHSLVIAGVVNVSLMDMDLIWMPVFMVFVYLLLAIRSMMMYKNFEHAYWMATIEGERELQAQRLRISADLHDSMGAQLTLMNMILDGLKERELRPYEVAERDNNFSGPEMGVVEQKGMIAEQKIEQLSKLSENLMLELKNTLWVLNLDEIHLDDLRAKLLNFINSVAEVKEEVEFDFSFEVRENVLMASSLAVDVFRMVQEIVNNALKHAQATRILVHLEQKVVLKNEEFLGRVEPEGHLKRMEPGERVLFLRIADNGIGFDFEMEKAKAYGLRNIEGRIVSRGGKFVVLSPASAMIGAMAGGVSVGADAMTSAMAGEAGAGVGVEYRIEIRL